MNNRVDIIQNLIAHHRIRSQQEFITMLAERGIRTTQATLSRDLKRIGVSKQRDASGESLYVLPVQQKPTEVLLAEGRAAESIRTLAFSGQMGVLKTLPGCAGMVGALVDSHTHPDLMGTLAGDDTLLLILRQGTPHAAFKAFLGSFIPGIEDKTTE